VLGISLDWDEPVLIRNFLSGCTEHEIYELLSARRRLSPGVEVKVASQRIRAALYVICIRVNALICQYTQISTLGIAEADIADGLIAASLLRS